MDFCLKFQMDFGQKNVGSNDLLEEIQFKFMRRSKLMQ